MEYERTTVSQQDNRPYFFSFFDPCWRASQWTVEGRLVPAITNIHSQAVPPVRHRRICTYTALKYTYSIFKTCPRAITLPRGLVKRGQKYFLFQQWIYSRDTTQFASDRQSDIILCRFRGECSINDWDWLALIK